MYKNGKHQNCLAQAGRDPRASTCREPASVSGRQRRSCAMGVGYHSAALDPFRATAACILKSLLVMYILKYSYLLKTNSMW